MKILREYILIFSILTVVIGFLLLLMGVLWYWFKDIKLSIYTEMIHQLENWNAYLLVIGIVILGIGLWYLYSYFTKRKFVLDELQTSKRSEFLKMHSELEDTVKYLPSRYRRMFDEKKNELKIK